MLNRKIVRRMKQVRSASEAQAWSKDAFDFPEELLADMTQETISGSLLAESNELFNKIPQASAEWKLAEHVSLFDRWTFSKIEDPVQPELFCWNIYHLIVLLHEFQRSSKLCYTLAEKALQKHQNVISQEMKCRLTGLKGIAIRFNVITNPFGYAEDGILLAREALKYDFEICDRHFWFQLQFNLSVLLLWRVKGDIHAAVEESIEILYGLLNKINPIAEVKMFGDIQNSLGSCFERRKKGNPAENIESAIHHYTLASKAMDIEPKPMRWAALQNNLGLAYRRRIRGDRGENIEKSLEYLRIALSAHLESKSYFLAAQTMTNIGVSYTERILGDRSENIEYAIHFYQQALKKMTQDHYAGFRAWTYNNLGTAYHHRLCGRKSSNLEKEISCYKEALKFREREKMPLEWVISIRNLGIAYSQRIMGDRESNLAIALKYIEGTFPELDREKYPVEWAHSHSHLGKIWLRTVSGDRKDNLKKAIGYFRSALEVFLPDVMPNESRLTAFSMGNAYLELTDYDAAVAAYKLAVAADRYRYRQTFLSQSQTSEIDVGSPVYYNIAYCLAKKGDYPNALRWLEKGKFRVLTEHFQLDRYLYEKLPEKTRLELRNSTEKLHTLYVEQYVPGRSLSTIVEETKAVRQELDRLISANFSQTGLLSETELNLNELNALLPPQSCAIEFCVTDFGTILFFLIPGRQELNIIPVFNNDFTTETLTYFMRSWSRSQKKWMNQIDAENSRALWGHFIINFFKKLSSQMFEPAGNILCEHPFKHLILIPHLSMHVLPLNLLGYRNNGKMTLLYDRHHISYFPNLTVALSCLKQTKQPEKSLAAVSNPTHDLKWAQHEVDQIRRFFPETNCSVLTGSKAMKKTVQEAIQSAGYVHFACHARFDQNEPYRSFLALAYDESDGIAEKIEISNSRLITHTVRSQPLMLVDIFTTIRFKEHPVIVLSACESGLIMLKDTSDEFIGFASGFLYSGARAVVSTLWKVDDRSTCLLMQHFYRNMIEKNMPVYQALQEAQLAVKSSGEYQNPFFWAAFKLNGV